MTHDNPAYDKSIPLHWRGWTATTVPSGTVLHNEHTGTQGGQGNPVLDLGDLRAIILSGMAQGGWADHFQAEIREALNAR